VCLSGKPLAQLSRKERTCCCWPERPSVTRRLGPRPTWTATAARTLPVLTTRRRTPWEEREMDDFRSSPEASTRSGRAFGGRMRFPLNGECRHSSYRSLRQS
jgi:hypothetical protein